MTLPIAVVVVLSFTAGWHPLVRHAGAQVLPPTVYLIGPPAPPPPPSPYDMVEPPPLAAAPDPPPDIMPDMTPILMPGDLSLSDIALVAPLTVDPVISVAPVIPPPPEVIVYRRTCWHEHRHVYCTQPRIIDQ